MATSISVVGRLGLVLLGLAGIIPSATALDQKYCSSMNTASGDGTPSIYQTTGLCYDQCVGTHAFAVLSDNLCWCSNYIPGNTVNREECNSPCKGYDKENCGGDGLYGYIKLNLQASGTKGAPSATSKKPEATTVTAPGITVTESVLATPSPSPTSSSTTSSKPTTSPTTSPSKTSTSGPSTTSAPSGTTADTAPSAFASTVTESGEERIITVIPTQAAPIETGKKSKDSGSGGSSKLSTGAAVGLTIGLVALASIVGIIIFLFLRRKRQHQDAEVLRSGSPGAPNSGVPSRTMSENSRYMLGTDGREVVGGWQQDGGMTQPGNRRSRLMPVDPRLDPFAPVYQRGDGAHSRESVMSIRDDRDYSRRVVGGPIIAGSSSPPRRVLGVINP